MKVIKVRTYASFKISPNLQRKTNKTKGSAKDRKMTFEGGRSALQPALEQKWTPDTCKEAVSEHG